MADVIVLEATRSKAEARLKTHIESSGWSVREILHCDLVQGVPVHDSRLGALIRTAKETTLASDFSPYGEQSQVDLAPGSPMLPSGASEEIVTPETPSPDQPAETPVEVEPPSPKRLVSPTLSGTLAADHAALQNDLEQAQELAADFQRQLAGKSNEYAQLKQLLEKTQADLTHLQTGIVQLRAERHHLANEVMRGQAFELKSKSLERKMEEQVVQLQQRDRQIAQLTVQIVQLRDALNEVQRSAVNTPKSMTHEKIELNEEVDIEITAENPRPLRIVR